jgi:hypothetical protein
VFALGAWDTKCNVAMLQLGEAAAGCWHGILDRFYRFWLGLGATDRCNSCWDWFFCRLFGLTPAGDESLHDVCVWVLWGEGGYFCMGLDPGYMSEARMGILMVHIVHHEKEKLV